MATIAEVLVRVLMPDVSDIDRERFDAAANHFGAQLVNFTGEVGRAVDAIGRSIVRSIEETEIDDKRHSLLQLYRLRHSWKTSDLVRLQTYPLNKAARNRMARVKALKRIGRGTTVAYHPIAVRLIFACKFIVDMYDPATPPLRRLRMLKQTRWWPEFVEMTYRGEYQRLKYLGGKATSARAELAVADACCISTATVKQLCHAVRKDAAAGMTLSGPIDVSDFETWKLTGRLPKHAGSES